MRRIGLMAMIVGLATGPALAAGIPDHLKCYKIKDPIILSGVLDVDTPQFGVDSGCTVSKAKLFCTPATKVVQSAVNKVTGLPITPLPVEGAPTSDDRVCYKLKCPVLPTDQQVTDQFGTRTLDLIKTAYVCTPAVLGTTYCGDGVKNGSEECDATDLGGATCGSEGFTSGTVTCGAGCQLDTSACTCGGGGGFPATGQTTCWNTAGSVVSCAGTGHDGDIQAGATLAYTDNGDGTVTDDNTGLMWEKLSDDGSIHDKDNLYTWANAFAVKVATLNSGSFAGYTDWRVPNVKELQSIVNYRNVGPAVLPAFNTSCTGGCTVTTCSCTGVIFLIYWSSSTYANDPTDAWGVIFDFGNVGVFGKPAAEYVRAVRGGS